MEGARTKSRTKKFPEVAPGPAVQCVPAPGKEGVQHPRSELEVRRKRTCRLTLDWQMEISIPIYEHEEVINESSSKWILEEEGGRGGEGEGERESSKATHQS